MELRQLRYFTILAEELHFGRAAKRINIAQPALSQQIKALEKELGSDLFHRTTHHVSLTESGKALLPDAYKLLENALSAMDVVSQVENGYRGELVFGFIESALWDIMPSIIPTYHQTYPEVKIIPCHMNSIKQINALERDEIQVGIVGKQFDLPGFSYHLLREESFILAIPSWHPLAKKKKVHIQELKQEKFIFIRRESGPFYFDFLIQTFTKHGFSPNIVLYSEELIPLLTFVACGMGIALVQESAIHMRPDLTYLLVEGIDTPAYRLSLAWKEENTTKTLLNFIDVAKKIFP